MRVTFIATTFARLPDIPIIDGQIIAIVDQLGYYYDLNNTRYNLSVEHLIRYLPELTEGTKIGTLEIDGDNIDVFAPTPPSAVSELTNDVGFITSTVENLSNYYLKSETYTQNEIDALIGAISTITFEVVSELPTTNIKTNVIYLVPKAESASQDTKDEYINIDGTSAGWELIGSTDVDLSDYAKLEDLPTKTSELVNDSGFVVNSSLGSAAYVNATTTIIAGGTDIPTTGAVYAYIDQTVTQALNASY